MGKRFDLQDKNYISDNLYKMTYRQIGENLGRTESSIAHAVVRYKLTGKGHSLDLINKRYGKLLVIEFSFTDNNGYAIWNCLCDCGKNKLVKSMNLTNGTTKSCGCLRRDNQYKTIEKLAYKGHKESAKNRGIETFLSLENYLEIAKKPCTYCGNFSIRKNLYTGATMNLNSVDRKNNENFYSIENCQSTCFICQKMKSDMLDGDFLNHLNKIMLYINAISN